ncbi:MAG: 50S ribosomal protein L25/general stress protein Ctc [Gammaproteobacteria bacterium]
MAISFVINAEPRADSGKGASRRLRQTGKVPAIIYGGDKDPESLTLSHNELLRNLQHEAFYSHILTVKMNGKDTRAVLRDIQRHPGKPLIMHMDLQRINESEKLKMHVPLHFLGEDTAPGIKAGGMVSHEMSEVHIECLPKDLPEYIEVDVSAFEIGDALHLSDIKVPETVTLLDLVRGEGQDLPVVSMHMKRIAEEVEEEAAGEGVEAPAAEGDEEAKGEGED